VSWYDDNFKRRAAISVPNSAGAASGDIDITIPPDWDEFWDIIDSAGEELRITQADGRTLVSYDVDKPGGGAFSVGARTGRLRIDGGTLKNTANACCLFWVYFDTDTTAGAGDVAVTMASILDGYIELGRPADRRIVLQKQPPGLTRPQSLESKESTATIHYWLDAAQVLELYRRPSSGHLQYEEVAGVLVVVKDDAGADADTLEVHADTRFVEVIRGRERRMWIRISVTGGTDGSRYTVGVVVYTSTPADSTNQTITHRFGLAVVDALEPAG
jgi:hypothetical protein